VYVRLTYARGNRNKEMDAAHQLPNYPSSNDDFHADPPSWWGLCQLCLKASPILPLSASLACSPRASMDADSGGGPSVAECGLCHIWDQPLI
jgi:hypothetical protein